MSFDLVVYLQRQRMPSPARWQQEISAAGLPIEIDQSFDVDAFTGFLPCKYKGRVSGFEYRASALSEDDSIELEVPGQDFEITLVARPGHNELQTALGAASALCTASGGILCDPQSGEMVPSDKANAWAAAASSRCRDDES